jgi:hypothetical protein
MNCDFAQKVLAEIGRLKTLSGKEGWFAQFFRFPQAFWPFKRGQATFPYLRDDS